MTDRRAFKSDELTPMQREELECVIEEASEVIKVCCKILRHGFDAYNPLKPGSHTNREELENELGDLSFWVRKLDREKQISLDQVMAAEQRKSLTYRDWTHYQE